MSVLLLDDPDLLVEPGQIWVLTVGPHEMRYTVKAVDGDVVTFEEKLTRSRHDGARLSHMLRSPDWRRGGGGG